jgi:glycosyltransferase involved in cell wall biosynthesis
MKILLISMPSVHAIRWIENLKDADFELYWFDVVGCGEIETVTSVQKFTDWKKRKIPHIKGEYFLSKKLPLLYAIIQPFLEITANQALEKIISQIKPDIVHSFEMQSCSYPIYHTMKKHPKIKWVYSCWGSDLFYYQNKKKHKSKIIKVLGRVNYLHTDCKRDFELAKYLAFKGEHIGVIPGGGGYKTGEFEIFKLPLDKRKIILVKGYEHKFGRALKVIKALEEIKNELKDYEVVVFGAHQIVIDYINVNNLPFEFYNRHELSHMKMMELMGRTYIYIGNSVSDGIPNTLLEAMLMGAFPIQSNPGGVTAEIIKNGENGVLIEGVNDISLIKNLIVDVLKNKEMIEKAFNFNGTLSKKHLDYKINQKKIVELYNSI